MVDIDDRTGVPLGWRLMVKLAAAAAFGGAVWLALTALTALPSSLVALVAVVASVVILADPEVRAAIRSTARGLRGEQAVETALESLPAGWRAFRNVDVGGETVGLVLVGRGGTFAVEVRHYSGRGVAAAWGLEVNGVRDDAVIVDANRLAQRLGQLLRVEVHPMLVVTGALQGDRVGRVAVLSPHRLVEFLERQPPILEFGEARRLWSVVSPLSD